MKKISITFCVIICLFFVACIPNEVFYRELDDGSYLQLRCYEGIELNTKEEIIYVKSQYSEDIIGHYKVLTEEEKNKLSCEYEFVPHDASENDGERFACIMENEAYFLFQFFESTNNGDDDRGRVWLYISFSSEENKEDYTSGLLDYNPYLIKEEDKVYSILCNISLKRLSTHEVNEKRPSTDGRF